MRCCIVLRQTTLLIMLAFWGRTVLAVPPALDIGDLAHRVLDGHAEFLVSTAQTLDELNRAAFQPLRPRDINRGITAETIWVRVRLENPRPEPRTWVLHHETAYLDHMIVHIREANGTSAGTHLSDRIPFDERPVRYRKLAYGHTTAPESYTDVYLRLSNDHRDSMTLRLHLWEREQFRSAAVDSDLVHGGYYGIMIALIVITLVSALVFRQSIYVYYLAYLLTTTLAWAAVNGFAYQYLWPQSVFWHNEGIHIIFLLFAVATLQFSKSFLRTAVSCPGIHPWLHALQGLMLAGIALRFAGVFAPVVYLSFAALLVLVSLPALAWLAYRRGLRYTRWYALAWIVYSIGLVVSVLSAGTTLFSWGLEPVAYAQGASLLESLLLLAALAERLRHWEVDREEAMRLASVDPLTELGNRRLLTESLDAFRFRYENNALPVFLLMIDLDHFKRINDTHGHEAGDEVLRAFAHMLKRMSREQDVCTRYGGEEFAVLFQAPSLDRALEMSERIRRAFADTPTEYRGQRIAHTFSGGLATVISEQEQLSAREMMMRADAAIYSAKSAGRNRMQVYEPGARDERFDDPSLTGSP